MRKRLVPKGIAYGKPINQGVTQLKFQHNKHSVAEECAGQKLGGLKVLNSHWINEDSTCKYYEITLVDVVHNAIRNDPRINQICKPIHKHRELRGLTSTRKKYKGLRGKGHLHHLDPQQSPRLSPLLVSHIRTPVHTIPCMDTFCGPFLKPMCLTLVFSCMLSKTGFSKILFSNNFNSSFLFFKK